MQLYPSITPYHDFHLSVGDGHQLHIQEYGEPCGLPVVICHGGPGAGLHADDCRFFDPTRYRIILYSQRGCGQSTPHLINANTTAELVADLDYLRTYLGLEKWVLSGGSWGATLSLLYAIEHTQHVQGLILRGTFLATAADFDWLYSRAGGAAHFYPELYARFSQNLPDVTSILAFYQQQLNDDNQINANHFAKLWCQWESVLSHGKQHHQWGLSSPQLGLNMARLMVHYFAARCFITDNFISEHYKKISKVPVWFIHGRHDLVCRFNAVQQLAEQLNAQLLILDGVGHGVDNNVYLAAVRRAADLMCIKLSRHKCKD
ncbi:alpha/beta fold hydrolase [Pseudoalteromonas sp. KAN5]|uniref:alpha/beta fold hydrolase n=1 Tax=Pseudoalteromonas sp. KAN5 TaxID=2916633 RepID=UPI001FCBEADE|nr:alpha/beta fold hydrolase [Pseudoalteromonas sp. KAN5]BDF95709.1 proline iminopeptidase [Pseudoalteromonas sp. KAN5]